MKKQFIFSIAFVVGIATVKSSFAQVPTCPIELPGPDYTNSSILGDKICPTLSNANIIVNGLSSNVNAKLNEVKTTMDNFKNTTLAGAINEEAVLQYNDAMAQIMALPTHISSYLSDAQCGVPGAMEALKNSFVRFGNDLTALASITSSFGNSFQKLGPILPELVKVSENVMGIASSVSNKTPEMEKQINKLTKAINALKSDFEKLLKQNPTELINTGATLATGVAPYLVNCTACATTLQSAIAGLGATGGGAAGGTATGAETAGVGAGIGAVVAALGSVEAAISGAISSVPCGAVVAQSTQVMEYIKDVQKFVTVVSSTASSLSKNAGNIIEASDAIVELGKMLGKENAPKVVAIHQSLIVISNVFSETAVSIETNVAPKVAALMGKKVKDLSDDINQLITCYNRLDETFGYMTADFIEAIKDFATATPNMVDANRIIQNLTGILGQAKTAAENSVKAKWDDLNQDKNSFLTALLGNDKDDLVKIANHMLGLTTKIDDLVEKASSLKNSVTGLVTSAAIAGKSGFLTSINTHKDEAENKYKQVKAKTTKYRIEVAKAKAAANARAKVRAATIAANQKASAALLPSVQVVTPLHNIAQLRIKSL